MANQKVSDIDNTMREVQGGSTMRGPSPGTSRVKGLVFENLGSIDDFPIEEVIDNETGTGEPCVVLSDVLTVEGATFTQGQVRRISKLVAGYSNPDIPRDLVKQNIRRLFELGAVRLATREEATLDVVEVNIAHETEHLQDERAKRIEAENENARLKAEIEQLRGTAKGGSKPPEKDPTFDD